ncbi:MAG: glycosyltransferase [Caldilineaceae bacterium]|nr:glycosyltransferase [Caldilineaceae bacterium]
MPKLDLSIVIVSWNVWDLLRACLQSIETATRAAKGKDTPQQRSFGPPGDERFLEVVVVDNASDDATAELLPSRFPWVRLIRSEENLGFTAGNNLGYAASSGQHIFFLNPDTELVPGDGGGESLWLLFAALADEEEVAMVGPQLRYADGSWQNNRRRFGRPPTGFAESTWLGKVPLVARQMGWYYMLDWPASFAHASTGWWVRRCLPGAMRWRQ